MTNSEWKCVCGNKLFCYEELETAFFEDKYHIKLGHQVVLSAEMTENKGMQKLRTC